jgi:plasmid stabilization system protein ParE
MTRTLVLSTLTEEDLSAARDWYNRKRPGLGEDLLLCVEQALDRILEYPEAFPAILPDVRRTLLRRFPYAVLYRVRQHRIEVEALFPLRAAPSRLWDRLNPAPGQNS